MEKLSKVEIGVNNKGKLIVGQPKPNNNYKVILKSVDSNGKEVRRDYISEGDFTMLMNYYRYIKDFDIKNDFINRNGKNKEIEYSIDEGREL